MSTVFKPICQLHGNNDALAEFSGYKKWALFSTQLSTSGWLICLLPWYFPKKYGPDHIVQVYNLHLATAVYYFVYYMIRAFVSQHLGDCWTNFSTYLYLRLRPCFYKHISTFLEFSLAYRFRSFDKNYWFKDPESLLIPENDLELLKIVIKNKNINMV